MRSRHGLAPAAIALALAVPSAAHAQGAGDDQYTDPFNGSSGTPTATPQPTTPQATATPAPAQSSSAAPAATAATATPAPAAASSSAGPTLPYTGVDAWIPGLSGVLLLGTGVALRVRLREPD